ncbi:uracil-DNA glycosylase family protein [Prevotella histicola]|jgi:mug protein|uniref:Uracil-DNA glycosylase family protein n=1 Tax=Prevotella histicola TaxID=470565 RepID=A0A930HX94_9BACT|nr:uracil-DNA glycosylase family protein [Prevotella histicola]MBF1411199.1 uracil-DNA glycosylase family protein [Prevotella histicola]MBF1414594.1 uracil-DNA glycosylase family protein [Prevotella histicola]MBW4738979.1 uracil-DNA glycosylase family protein [Prevotella histicola]MBW4747194.1 uracil-DNA glycosylase family protein [Prevotella histicola]
MDIETHPFEPWLPSNAKLLLLGTFPPAPKRWCMEWYYPNYTNDMWRIFGYVFFEDKKYFVDEANKTYKLDLLRAFLKDKGIAIFDTALRIRRTTGTASDKDLEIVEPADLDHMLRVLPQCKAVLAAGQLATKVFTDHYQIDARKMQMGDYKEFTFEGRTIRLYREPSSSRAYPMKVEKKAEYYKQMLSEVGLLDD